MAIIRVTENIGLAIQEKGTVNWGETLNQNFDFIDFAFGEDRSRLDNLESEAGILPLALAGKIGHNLLRNNIFARGIASDPAQAIGWTSVFANGANGHTTRDSSTYVIGKGGTSGAYSQRVTILNVNIANQIQPFPNMNMKDPSTNTTLAANDERQLLRSFGYVFQSLEISPNTKYTLSSFGKADIPATAPPINVHWKVGVVFKDVNQNIIYSYFSTPQRNFTSNKGTDSFKRCELSFTSPNLPVVNCEVWLVCESGTSGSLGSVYFDGVQLEQSGRATQLESFTARNGDMFIDGDLYIGGNLVLQQDQLTFDVANLVFSGNVQIGDDINNDILNVYTMLSTFHGNVDILGNTKIGDSPTVDIVEVRALKTTFFDNQNSINPLGGDVEIQGDLFVKQNVIIGDDKFEDNLTVNGTVDIFNDTSIDGDVSVTGFLHIDREVILGTNNVLDKFTVNMATLGSEFTGDVKMNNKLNVVQDVALNSNLFLDGSQTIGEDLDLTGALYVGGPVTLDIGTNSGDNFNMLVKDIVVNGSTGTTIWNSSNFDLSGSLEVGSNSALQSFHALVGSVILGSPSLANSTSVAINAITTSLTGSLDVSENATLDGDLIVGAKNSGTVFLGTQVASGRVLASFSGEKVTPTIGPMAGQDIIKSQISLGDANALIVDLNGRTVFDSEILINGGTVYIGSAGTGSGGDEVCGDVVIGGDLTVGGKVRLGNQKTSDILEVKSFRVDIDVGNGNVNIGGGFVDNAYNPSVADHGGVTIDALGNVQMDGKLTVKGPIDPIRLELTPISGHANNKTIEIKKDGILDVLTIDRDGNYFTNTGSMIVKNHSLLNDSVTLGTASSLTAINLNSNQVNVSGNFDVDGSSTLNNLLCENQAIIFGQTSIGDDLVVTKNVTATGTDFIFGNSVDTLGPNTTHFKALVNETIFGLDGQRIGNVVIGNNLDVRASSNLGTDVEVDEHIVKGHTITLEVASRRQILPFGQQLELAGVRIGGGVNGPGYQNKIYNELELDHGGVTIDAYGNIFADGIITSRGPLAFDTLTLNTPNGTVDGNVAFNILNMNLGMGDEVFRVDNLGGVRADGYLELYSEHMLLAPDSSFDRAVDLAGNFLPVAATDGYAIFSINNVDLDERVFEVDDFGNQLNKGIIVNKYPGGSNLATYSVTVGDGIQSHGDFNLAGMHNASANPIQAAIDYLKNLTNPNGVIFIKRGAYNLPLGGLTLYDNISLYGEGAATILNGSGTTTTGIACAQKSKVQDLTITNCIVGISIGASIKDCHIKDNYISACTTGINVVGNQHLVSGNTITNGATGVNISGNENGISLNYISDNSIVGIISSGDYNVMVANVTMRNG